MRYIEDIEETGGNYTKLFAGNEQELEEYAYQLPENITWLLTKDNWKALVKNKYTCSMAASYRKQTQIFPPSAICGRSPFRDQRILCQNWKAEKENHTIKGLTVTARTNDLWN